MRQFLNQNSSSDAEKYFYEEYNLQIFLDNKEKEGKFQGWRGDIIMFLTLPPTWWRMTNKLLLSGSTWDLKQEGGGEQSGTCVMETLHQYTSTGAGGDNFWNTTVAPFSDPGYVYSPAQV